MRLSPTVFAINFASLLRNHQKTVRKMQKSRQKSLKTRTLSCCNGTVTFALPSGLDSKSKQ